MESTSSWACFSFLSPRVRIFNVFKFKVLILLSFGFLGFGFFKKGLGFSIETREFQR